MAAPFASLLFRNTVYHYTRHNLFCRAFRLSAFSKAKVGDPLPSIELFEGNPGNAVNIAELCKNKKVVIFGVPGAFTPACSKTHLPGFVSRFSELKKKGVNEIICISVNDAFVMEAWGKEHKATGKIRMLSDPDAAFTKATGLDVNLPKLGGTRSKRYAMIVDNGVVSFLGVEPDGTGLSCSLAVNLPL